MLWASERARGTKYRVQLGTPNEVSGRDRLYTLVVYVLPKNNQSQCNQTAMETEWNRTAHIAERNQTAHKAEYNQTAHKAEYNQTAHKAEYNQTAHK